MRTLITGGCGFIGSHLCDRFIADGHEVVCMDNLITGQHENIAHLQGNPKFSFIKHDVSQRINVDGHIDNVLHRLYGMRVPDLMVWGGETPTTQPGYQVDPVVWSDEKLAS